MCTWMVYSIQRLGPFSSRGTEQVSTMDPKAQPQGLRQDENGGHATIAPASCASCGWFRWTMLDHVGPIPRDMVFKNREMC